MKMKNCKNIFLICFCALLVSSCSDDFLGLTPKGSETEANYYQNEEEIFAGLVAAYDPLSWGGTNGWTMTLGLLNAASDDCFAGGSDASDQPAWVAYDNFTLNPELGPQSGLWSKYYTGIARCNLLLEKVDLLEDLDPAFRNRTIGELKFLRGYYYFDLIRFFGNVILSTDRINPEEIFDLEQSPKSAAYDFIISDLTDAYNTFEIPSSLIPAEYGRVTRPAVTALLAKVILYQGDESQFGLATQYFEEIINGGQFDLEPDFSRIFAQDNEWGIESIWEIQFSNAHRGGWDNFENQTEGNYNTQFFGMRDYVGPTFANGWSFCPVTQDLVDVMINDPRFEHTIIDGEVLQNQGASYTEGYQNTNYFIKKYAGLQENVATDGEAALNWANNERVIRFADVLLMAAETIARSGGDEGKAKEYLNRVRSRVGLQPLSNSGQSLIDAIYRERRLELATEGHRFFDLVRSGQASQFLEGFQNGKNEVLPIPQREIDLTAGTLKQNPGY